MSDQQLPPSSSRPPLRPIKVGVVAFLLGPALLLMLEPINELIKLFNGGHENLENGIQLMSVVYSFGLLIALGLGFVDFLKSHQAAAPGKARSVAIIGIVLTVLGFFCSPIAVLILFSLPFCFGMC